MLLYLSQCDPQSIPYGYNYIYRNMIHEYTSFYFQYIFIIKVHYGFQLINEFCPCLSR